MMKKAMLAVVMLCAAVGGGQQETPLQATMCKPGGVSIKGDIISHRCSENGKWAGVRIFGQQFDSCTDDAACITSTYGWISSSGDDEYGLASVRVESKQGRIDRLSDAEYERLEKLRKQLRDAEVEVAKAHGVRIVSQYDCLQMLRGGAPEDVKLFGPELARTRDCKINDYPEQRDKWQIRGQWLTVNTPFDVPEVGR